MTSREKHTPILVVDDDRDIRETMAAVLQDCGYTVYEASNGREALHYLLSVPECMVVLLDLNMPIMDGFDVLRTVRQDLRLQRGHAFLVVTASSHQPIPPDILDLFAGMSIPFVPKPFDLDDLLDKVEYAARQCVARRQSPRVSHPSYQDVAQTITQQEYPAGVARRWGHWVLSGPPGS